MCSDCPTTQDRIKAVRHSLIAEAGALLVLAVSVAFVAVVAIQMRIV